MSLEIWLATGRDVVIGGRTFKLMPLPLRHLNTLGKWLEGNCNDLVKQVIASAKTAQEINPFGMVTEILLRIDVNELIYQMLTQAKDPETREPINVVTKDFIDEYLDPMSAQKFVETFIEVNDLHELIKNLRRLPILQKLMDAALSTFGLPYLSSLQPNTVSAQKLSEGSPTPKSSSTSPGATTAQPEAGKSSKPEEKPPLLQ